PWRSAAEYEARFQNSTAVRFKWALKHCSGTRHSSAGFETRSLNLTLQDRFAGSVACANPAPTASPSYLSDKRHKKNHMLSYTPACSKLAGACFGGMPSRKSALAV